MKLIKASRQVNPETYQPEAVLKISIPLEKYWGICAEFDKDVANKILADQFIEILDGLSDK